MTRDRGCKSSIRGPTLTAMNAFKLLIIRYLYEHSCDLFHQTSIID